MDKIISKGTLPPKIVEVKPIDDYKLHLTFENDEERIFDMKPYLYGVFTRLEDPGYFKRVRIVEGSIEWPDGQDLYRGMLYKNSEALEVPK